MMSRSNKTGGLRQSHKFLAKQCVREPTCSFFCCDQAQVYQNRLQNYTYFRPKPDKISIKRLIKERSTANLLPNNNNQNSTSKVSKHTLKSNISQIKLNQNRMKFFHLPKVPAFPINREPYVQFPAHKIHFNYADRPYNQNNVDPYHTNKPFTPKEGPYYTKKQERSHPQAQDDPMIVLEDNNNITIEEEINNILNLDQSPQENQRFKPCGEAFKIDELVMPNKNKSPTVNFSFGQNQKATFMQKYLKTKEYGQKMPTEIKQQVIQFFHGTFSKESRLNFAEKQKVHLRSQQQVCQSVQSQVIESYQSMLKTKSKEDQTHNIHN